MRDRQKITRFAALLIGLALLGLRSALPARAQALPPFPDFQSHLEQTLKAHGLDPQNQAFHYVVLLNTVSTQGPVPQGMRNILEGLLSHYLTAPASGPGDMISFSAFEMHLRPEGQVWNQPFSTSAADALLKTLPDRPQERSENGGHDVEASLLEAIDHLNSRASTVILVLSDTEISHTPLTQLNYPLEDRKPNYTKRLAAVGFAEAAQGPLQGNFTGKGTSSEGTVWYRLYLPSAPQPLASLPNGRFPAPTPPIINPPAQETGTASSGGADSPNTEVVLQSSSGADPWPYVAVGVVVLGLGLYGYWIFQPRTVQIGSATGTIRFQQDVFIGNASAGGSGLGRNAIQVAEIPSGQKVGVLRLTPLGAIVLRGTGRYKIDTGQVLLAATPKKVVVRDGNSKILDMNVQTLR